MLCEICSNGAAMGSNEVERQGKTDSVIFQKKMYPSATSESFKIQVIVDDRRHLKELSLFYCV